MVSKNIADLTHPLQSGVCTVEGVWGGRAGWVGGWVGGLLRGCWGGTVRNDGECAYDVVVHAMSWVGGACMTQSDTL